MEDIARRRQNQQVHQTQGYYDDILDDHQDDGDDLYEAFVAQQQQRRVPLLNSEAWNSLSRADRQAWTQLSPQGRKTIIKSQYTLTLRQTTSLMMMIRVPTLDVTRTAT